MMKWVEVEFQGQRHRIPAMKHQCRLWFHFRGETHVVDMGGGARRVAGEKTSLKPGLIVAPMPGKITRVAVRSGDTVSKGDALVVMEAMKMEYTLEADRAGKVLEISAEVGAQVGLGAILVRLGD